ncbi:MAG: hypothetical protein IH962_05060, partial [Chloroflexi bacterium]|nr:hypothetical protein [Chloroflexota bacterium]
PDTACVTLAIDIGKYLCHWALLAWRAPRLKADHDFESLLSRETGLILNNYLLTAIALIAV